MIFSAGSGSPITPVEEVKTCAAGICERGPAAAAAICATSDAPRAPVKVLALPEFTTMAKPFCGASGRAASFSWQSSTAAERVAERVKTPARGRARRDLGQHHVGAVLVTHARFARGETDAVE